ncbi:MAG: acyltransferase [Bradyrhizobiaceae bacterium]|nr:acyltransferase [Bradyrhizobiaceae bacterium]
MKSSEHLRPLTSLRFMAASMVVLHHAPHLFVWPALQHLPATLFHGVSFFFVLSGFILTHVYRARPWPGYWQFFVLRIGRIWPVHAAALAFLLAASAFGDAVMGPLGITYGGEGFLNRWVSFGLVATMTQSLSPYIPHSWGWNSPSWSISTEFAFYAMFPFLLIGIERRWLTNLLASLVVVLAALTSLYFSGLAFWDDDVTVLTKASIAYASPVMRLPEFCLGMAAWVIWDRYIRALRLSFIAWSAIELAAVALAGWWFTSNLFTAISATDFLQPWFYSAGSCWAFAILIILIASGRGLLGRVLSIPPLVFLGEISYSLYLWHLIVCKIFFYQHWNQIEPIYFFALLLVLAGASYLLIEKPCRSRVARMVGAADRNRSHPHADRSRNAGITADAAIARPAYAGEATP